MGIVKVLKRKDAASVVVAIVVAMVLYQLVNQLTGKAAGELIGLKEGEFLSYSPPGAGWKILYLHPVVSAALQLLALEILVWLYVGAHSMVAKKK